MERHSEFWVYIVKCCDGSFYTGHTRHLKLRVQEHNDGCGSKYLLTKRPVILVYAKKYYYYKNVLKAERRIKRLIRSRKEKLIRIYDKEKRNEF